MRKKLVGMVLGVMMLAGLAFVGGCGNAGASSGGDGSSQPTGPISVFTREDGSGTRGAFIELFEVQEKDSSGKTVDMTTTSASITNSTSVMMTSVAGDKSAIGYISLGSLNDTVKALKIDGTEATTANVKSGSYKIVRPFNIATKSGLSAVAQDFVDFIMSAEGQKVIADNGYIAVDEAAKAYKSSGKTGKVIVAGSSSVTPVMEKLAEEYKNLNPGVTIEVQMSDSTTGMNMAKEGTCDIGMASRELKDSETSEGLKSTTIAQDGIAVIVNKDVALDGLTKEQVKEVYTGAISTWEDLL
ncbi:MAG: substrate-binding domain-containing protein [Coriobacteriaceae bacterium]|jgi:phosphate transport system substrate-binding protein|nr:substrate-binding domain-containing protein [Coriobacteriaceae bacterium]